MRYAIVMLFLLLVPFAIGAEYYADAQIVVDESGTAFISGTSNHPLLLDSPTDLLTSKKGSYWLFNLTIPEPSDYVIQTRFPPNAVISYVDAAENLRIADDNGLSFIISGTNTTAKIIVQYKLSPDNISYTNWFIILSLMIVFLLITLAYKSSLFKSFFSRNNYSRLLTVKKTLSESQQKIIDVLIKAGNPITQKQVQLRSNLPKATISRNIDILVNKKILVKEPRGMSNIIYISAEFKKK